ncbi:MAG: GNAT family N-acetyltransferase [Calditrichia bacterium]
MNGYANEQYAASLSEFGSLLHLPAAGGWLIKREIPETNYSDAMGLYPLFQCNDWQALEKDFEWLREVVSSIVLVCDPLEQVSVEQLKDLFPDCCNAFKQHFLIDLNLKPENFVSSHHRYYSRYATKRCSIQREPYSAECLTDWMALYQNLITRQNIIGIQCFSEEAFRQQLQMEDIDIFTARANGSVVGMQLWIRHQDRAYHHLSAYSEAGYANRCSYGLLWRAIQEYKKADYSWLNLGGTAGAVASQNGLAAFKKGWSTTAETAWLCGKILCADSYRRLMDRRGTKATSYFPAYRAG